MFDKIKAKVVGYFTANWKKLVAAVVSGGVAFLVLRFLIPSLLDVGVVSLGGAIAVGYLFYVKVAAWELEKLLSEAKQIVK
jgi:hypothetical protein